MQPPGPLSETLFELREAGFRAFKLGWGPFGKAGSAQDEAIVRTARETIGEDCDLMVDAGASDAFWPRDLKWALKTAEMLAGYDVAWFEEPLRPDMIEDYTVLRQSSPVPIASGEVLTRRQAFRPWIEAEALDIVQPDVTKVGGLSEMRRIGWSAQDRGLRLIPHGWNTAVGLAADLHLASALHDTDFVEYKTGSPYIDDLVASPWTLDADGCLKVPNGPGLGISLDQERLQHFSTD